MINNTTATTEVVPTNPEIAKRRAQADADDINTYIDTIGDPTLVPRGFADPVMSRLGERNPYFIRVVDRPYYFRSAEEDRRILDSLPKDWSGWSQDLDPNGPPLPISRRDPELLLHAFALRKARTRRKEAEAQALEDRRDRTERTCAACGIVDATGVQPRSIGGWTHRMGSDGPRLCLSCAKVAVRQTMIAWEHSVSALGDEPTPSGPRAAAVSEWIATNQRRILI